jgi:hypothetical protein
MEAAKSVITSIVPRASAVSTRRSTSVSMRGWSARSVRGVNDGASSLRTRVWIGGSLKTRLVVWCS